MARGRKRWRRVLRELHSELSAPEHSRRLLFRPSCRQFVRFPANVYCRDGPPTGSLIPTSATEVRRTPARPRGPRLTRSRALTVSLRARAPRRGRAALSARGSAGSPSSAGCVRAGGSRSARPRTGGRRPFLHSFGVYINFDTARAHAENSSGIHTSRIRSAAGPESGSAPPAPAAPGCANCAFARATNWSHFIMTANSL